MNCNVFGKMSGRWRSDGMSVDWMGGYVCQNIEERKEYVEKEC